MMYLNYPSGVFNIVYNKMCKLYDIIQTFPEIILYFVYNYYYITILHA